MAPLDHATNSSVPARRAGTGRAAWKVTKWWLYWVHRWLGVVTCLFCVMWFATGLVMLYVPFPSWSDHERLSHLPPVDLSQARVTPDEALAVSGIRGMPTTFRLEMFAGAPVYRIVSDDKRTSIGAVSGASINHVSAGDAQQHLRLTFPDTHPSLTDTIDADQWTPTRRFDPHRPLYRFALNDPDGTVVYVSSTTGEIVQNATWRERAWNWAGAVPHWIYFTPIRRDQEFWRQAVMWLSGPLVIGAVSGVWVGILRLRVAAAKAGRSVSPYRGWMKWHHIAGLIGGLFVVTWIFSGWLSVNPFHWFARTALTPVQLTAYSGWTATSRLQTSTAVLQAAAGATDISFTWAGGRPLMAAHTSTARLLYDASTGDAVSLSDAELVDAASKMYPNSRVTEFRRLTEETIYWYSHHDQRQLPIVEVSFDAVSRTSIYVDPATGKIAGVIDRSARANRWLFDFLHDYDLPVLLRNSPVREVLIWLLSLAGMIISVSGVVIAWRTLKRPVR